MHTSELDRVDLLELQLGYLGTVTVALIKLKVEGLTYMPSTFSNLCIWYLLSSHWKQRVSIMKAFTNPGSNLLCGKWYCPRVLISGYCREIHQTLPCAQLSIVRLHSKMVWNFGDHESHDKVS